MRTFGLFVLLLGVVALAAPLIRDSLPLVSAFPDYSLRIIGGCLVALGAIVISMTSNGSEG